MEGVVVHRSWLLRPPSMHARRRHTHRRDLIGPPELDGVVACWPRRPWPPLVRRTARTPHWGVHHFLSPDPCRAGGYPISTRINASISNAFTDADFTSNTVVSEVNIEVDKVAALENRIAEITANLHKTPQDGGRLCLLQGHDAV